MLINISEFLIYHFYQLSYWFIVTAGHKPVSEVPLYSHMQHFFLLGCQLGTFDLLLNLSELFKSVLQYIIVLLRAEEQRMVIELLRQAHFHEINRLHYLVGLLSDVELQRARKVVDVVLNLSLNLLRNLHARSYISNASLSQVIK